MLGEALLCLGEFVTARKHLEQGIALYDSKQHRSLAFLYGNDTGVACLSRVAQALWFLGYPDQALKKGHEALALAQKLPHPFSLAFALYFAAMVQQYRREGQAAQERAEAAIALSSEQGFLALLTQGTMLRGWALDKQGRREEGIEQMRQGLAASPMTERGLTRPYNLALLAEAYEERGQTEEGLTLLAEALVVVGKTGERMYEAELYRLAGELSLRIEESEAGRTGERKILSDSPFPRFPVSSPQECFQKAVETARKQQAKSLELRAVMSLAKLWRQQGKQKEAHEMLVEIYGRFTEGFDTHDLQEAKALLTELSHMNH
jgi:predicted ATPase